MYRYYRSRKNTTDSFAYFEALVALIVAFILSGFVLLIFFDLMTYFPGVSSETPRYIEYLVGVVVSLPIIYALTKLFKKKDMMEMEMDKPTRRIGYRLIIFYIVSTFILIMYLAVTRITIYDFL